MGKGSKRTVKAIKKVSIHGEIYRIIRKTGRTGVRRRKTRGLQLQSYGKPIRGKKRWFDVGGGFKKSMAGMNKYIENWRKAKH